MKRGLRSQNAVPMKEALDAFLDSFNLKSKFNETSLVASWEKIMGQTIASRTDKIFVRSGTLFLRITSAPLRQELVLAKSKLISLINREMGHELVNEVVFI
ncbi:MAG: hypothetical protein ACI9IP_000329 [Arcticibacterium sp.]|jgi:hypothetical protein